MSGIIRLNPPGIPDASGLGYSQVSIVQPGPMAYISGQVASTSDGMPPPAGLAEQVKLATANARTALEAIGATTSDIVMLRCYVTALNDDRLAELFPPLLEFLQGAQPSLTGVGVEALAGPGLQFEIELVVRLPD